MSNRKPLQYPRYQAWGNDETFLNGGTIEFFDAGTSNNRNIYQDAALTTTAPNPVTLNSRGEPQSSGGTAIDIYLDEQPYKIVLKDSSGTTVHTIDDYVADQTAATHVSSLSDLQAQDTTLYSSGESVYMESRSTAGDGGEGHFRWDSSDLSTEVGNDEVTTNEGDGGIYVAPASDKTGASGAWVRQFNHTAGLLADWWGFAADGSDETTAFKAMLATQRSLGTTSGALKYAVPDIRLDPNGIYGVTSLTISDTAGGGIYGGGHIAPNAAGPPCGAEIRYVGAGSEDLLSLEGVVWFNIDGVRLAAGTNTPDRLLRYDKSANSALSTIDLSNVAFLGNGTNDGCIAVDLGPNSTDNTSDHNVGRVEFRNIQTGWKQEHIQVLCSNIEYVRAVTVGVAFDIVQGGSLRVGTYNATNVGTGFKIRGGGINSGTFVIDNARQEPGGTGASDVFLDAASDAQGPLCVVINGLLIQSSLTGTHIKVGDATTVIVNGGLISTGTVDCSGSKDDGDAVFLMNGGIFSASVTTNTFGYYSIAHYMDATASQESPWGGDVIRTTGTKALTQNKEKLPGGAQKRYFTMPLTRAGGSTTSRTIPDDALVTAIDICIEDTGTATSTEGIDIKVGESTVISLDPSVAGPRHVGWQSNDLQTGDTDTNPLGSTTILSALDSTHTVIAQLNGGDFAKTRSITAVCVVEYIVESILATGIDS